VPPVITARGLAPEMLLAAIRDAHLDPCLLSPHPAPSRIARLTCPSVCLDFAAIGPAMHFTGEMARTCYTLVFVLACPTKGRSFNFSVEHTDGYMGFFPPGGVLDAVTPEGYANATLTVPAADFHAALERHFPEAPEKVLKSGAAMLIGPDEQARLRALLARIEKSLWRSPEMFTGSPIRRQVERELLAVFLAALRSGCADLAPPPSNRIDSRHRRLRQAREFLASHTHEPIYLDDLCATLGLTSRGVENLFQDLLGISPMTYLRHQRLHGVRRTLLPAAPAPGAVKFAAREWGFLHQGRFAHDYRALFGESPIETLARC
jgi:AraC-like DNA-binding protein